jgi:DNA-binding Xre family transcriptional regulator
MKEKDGYIDCPQQQVILYVEMENGKYGPIQTGSYITRNFLDDYELKRKHLEDALRNKIQNKEVSPIYYYMVLEDLTISELAARVNLRKAKVKKHLEYGSFNSIKSEILNQYADVFNVSVDDLIQLMNLGR